MAKLIHLFHKDLKVGMILHHVKETATNYQPVRITEVRDTFHKGIALYTNVNVESTAMRFNKDFRRHYGIIQEEEDRRLLVIEMKEIFNG